MLVRQRMGRLQHPLAGWGERGPAAAAAAHHLFHQRHPGQVGQRLQCLPGGLVAHARAPRRLGNGAHLANAAQDVDALVRGLVAQHLGQWQ